jgi:quaternary ammonium compound-resistance protein SugE
VRGHVLPLDGQKSGTARHLVREAVVAWLALLVAGVLEVVWAFSMKQSEGFIRPWPTAVMVVAMAASFWLLAISMRSLPLSTAYTVWTGIGAVGAFVVGIALLGEAVSPTRLVAAALIVGGLLLMKLSSPV